MTRIDYKKVPPHVDYALPELGRSLQQALVPLCAWGTENVEAVRGVMERRAT